ncbi:MAG: DegT/DnrJ/EryC1/StrS family aminotransferase [Verrucomicrobia bacterium]|nr:DegT/DnrJ/EryC1/StrS family aminotransferase [Verrucomicrobiota bacterium]
MIPRDYWEHRWSDLFVALFADWQRESGDTVVELSGVGGCVPAQSGRAALVAALRALGLPREARVGVPLFCCPVVFQAIRSAGCRPVFVDVDPESFCLCPQDLAAKVYHLDAVLAVHMFGNLCDVPAIRRLSGQRPIIEDCAQALGSRLGTQPAGHMGTVAFFSFRSGKYLSAGWGGALFTKDTALRARLREVIGSQPRPSRVAAARHTLAQFLKSVLRSRPAYGWFGYRLWETAGARELRGDCTAIRPDPIFPGDLTVARRRVRGLEAAIQTQRAYADYLENSLTVDRTMLRQERAGTFANRYLFPVRLASSAERDRLADRLRAKGVDTMRYLDDVVGVARERYGYAGDCPESERLSRTVLVLPTYHALRVKDLRRIVAATNELWEEIRRSRCAEKLDAGSRVASANAS